MLAAADVNRILRRDLEVVHALTQAQGVRLILLTYAEAAYRQHASISYELVRFAAKNDVTIVDPRDRFSSLLAEPKPRSEYYLDERDDHPNARGYAEIAALIVEVIEPGAGRSK